MTPSTRRDGWASRPIPGPGHSSPRSWSRSRSAGASPTTGSGRSAASLATSRTPRSWPGWPSTEPSNRLAASASGGRSLTGKRYATRFTPRFARAGTTRREAPSRALTARRRSTPPCFSSPWSASCPRTTRASPPRCAPWNGTSCRTASSCGTAPTIGTPTGSPRAKARFSPAASGWPTPTCRSVGARTPAGCSGGCSRSATTSVSSRKSTIRARAACWGTSRRPSLISASSTPPTTSRPPPSGRYSTVTSSSPSPSVRPGERTRGTASAGAAAPPAESRVAGRRSVGGGLGRPLQPERVPLVAEHAHVHALAVLDRELDPAQPVILGQPPSPARQDVERLGALSPAHPAPGVRRPEQRLLGPPPRRPLEHLLHLLQVTTPVEAGRQHRPALHPLVPRPFEVGPRARRIVQRGVPYGADLFVDLRGEQRLPARQRPHRVQPFDGPLEAAPVQELLDLEPRRLDRLARAAHEQHGQQRPHQ